MALYDEALLARLPAHGREGAVAALCRKDPDTYATAVATLIEKWIERFRPSGKTIAELTGADDSSFWAALWELTAAALMAELEFEVDMRARIGGLTPDLVIRRQDLTAMVEIFAIDNDKTMVDEAALLRRLSADLTQRVELAPATFVSLSLLNPLEAYPCEGTVESLAVAIGRALQAGDWVDLTGHDLPMHGGSMVGSDPSKIYVGPGARMLNQVPRIGRRIAEKIERYAPLVTCDRRLLVAVCANGWTITEGQVVDALYGHEVAHFQGDGAVVQLSFDGKGAAVLGGPNGAKNAAALTGTWILDRAGWRDEEPAVDVRASFAYNPYCEVPLPPGTFSPVREMRVQGNAVGWVGETGHVRLT
jgi:hypothetical protein